MFTSLLGIAAGIALVWLSIFVTAIGIFILVTLYRTRMQALAIKQTEDEFALQKLQSTNRLVVGILTRVDEIAERLSTVSSEAFMAEIDAVYQKAEEVPPVSNETVRSVTRQNIGTGTFIGDA